MSNSDNGDLRQIVGLLLDVVFAMLRNIPDLPYVMYGANSSDAPYYVTEATSA